MIKPKNKNLAIDNTKLTIIKIFNLSNILSIDDLL